jgi:hypothetical protein
VKVREPDEYGALDIRDFDAEELDDEERVEVQTIVVYANKKGSRLLNFLCNFLAR